MPSEARWRSAQEYERSYWQRRAQGIQAGAEGGLNFYGWKAKQMEIRLEEIFPEDRKAKARVLEVGCGPVGIVSALKWGERYAIDPLDDFYSSNATLAQHRDPAVHYAKSMGEEIKFPDGNFDLVILENVLDHVQTAEQLLHEIRRVMRDDGFFYLTVNVRHGWGTALHRVLSRLKIDKGHPYSFTQSSARAFIQAAGFEVLRETIDDYRAARTIDRNGNLKGKIKGYSGLTEFVFYCVCRKSGGK